MRRKPAVAGTFYPARGEELKVLVDTLCGSEVQEKLRAKAILVPHAGLIYSGKTACEVYKRVEIPERILIVGPNHTGYGPEVALHPPGVWESPLGDVSLDEELISALSQNPKVSLDHTAHLYEHSLEVQLPFLFRYAKGEFKITPLVLGWLDYESARDLGRFIGEILKSLPALVVISSDMSHYISAEEARKRDFILISAMERLATDELYYKRVQYNVSMCGFIPAVVGIEASKVLGAKAGRLIDYTHSGEVNGDYDRVVAYAGMIFL